MIGICTPVSCITHYKMTVSELIKELQKLENCGDGDKQVTICGDETVCIYRTSNRITLDNDEDLYPELLDD